MIAARTLSESAERPLFGKQLSVSIVRSWPPAVRLFALNRSFRSTLPNLTVTVEPLSANGSSRPGADDREGRLSGRSARRHRGADPGTECPHNTRFFRRMIFSSGRSVLGGCIYVSASNHA